MTYNVNKSSSFILECALELNLFTDELCKHDNILNFATKVGNRGWLKTLSRLGEMYGILMNVATTLNPSIANKIKHNRF